MTFSARSRFLQTVSRKLRQRSQRRLPWTERRYLAVDIETNGLNPREDALLAIGWVPVEPPRIRIDQACYRVIQIDATENSVVLGQSAVVHQLSQQQLRQGEPLQKVLTEFTEAARGATLIAHHAPFDRAGLETACRQHGLPAPGSDWLDTLAIEKRLLSRSGRPSEQGALTLDSCRLRYGLPKYSAHHALNDAIACAELFLAQQYRLRR